MAYRGFGLFLVSMALAFPAVAEDAAPAEGAVGRTEMVIRAPGENPDPWEKFNRSVYRFNDTLDRYALRPVAKGYKKVTPAPVRTGVTNFFNNLRSPIVVLNDVLQGKVRQAGKDTARFVVNSTIGIVGLWDVAVHMNLPANEEDFGQTLGVWGMKPGPYVMLPFFGPSSVRDTIGFGVDTATNPRRYLMNTDADLLLTGLNAVNSRASLLDLESIVQGDRYLFIRDLYLQRREFSVHDGQVADPFLDDDFGDEIEDGVEEAPAEPVDEAPAGGAEAGDAAPASLNDESATGAESLVPDAGNNDTHQS